MTAYEVLKQVLFPDIGIWESHLVTIVFTSVLGTALAYFAFRRLDRLNGELEKRVEMFSHSVAHDLRTSLRAMSSFATLLARRPSVASDAQAVGDAARVTQAAAEADRLVAELLRGAERPRT
jgi:light-regulated signal transduction histidine kinase (bacteriophytochrome)